ncbi:baseplate protein [Agrobacterium phage OLIVR4]|nr:baseplate protein [Agrobacterium phage OLIVR4]
MTTTKTFDERNRDTQDGFERHLFKRIDHTDTGAFVSVEGSGTSEEDVPVMNTGYGFSLEDDTEAEVFLLGDGSDASNKFAIPTLPRNKQRKWPKNTGGVQHPTNSGKFVQLDDDSIWLKDGSFTLGDDRAVRITVNGNNVVMEMGGEMDIRCAKLMHNGVNIGDTHVHTQQPDSAGDNEEDTDPPKRD